MEEHREIIDGLMRRQGYTEEEAEVAYHLGQAERERNDFHTFAERSYPQTAKNNARTDT